MGGCCSCFHICDTEENGVSPRRRRTRIRATIWNKIRQCLPIEGETRNSREDKDELIEGREDSRVDHMERVIRKGKQLTEPQWEPQLKFSLAKPEVAYAWGSSEDEDVCPTCLEEYIPENPRIVLQCSHSYHLGCIYEWMERSSNCPICGKMMIFSEEA